MWRIGGGECINVRKWMLVNGNQPTCENTEKWGTSTPSIETNIKHCYSHITLWIWSKILWKFLGTIAQKCSGCDDGNVNKCCAWSQQILWGVLRY